MPPSDSDLHEMVDALFAVNAGLERIRRRTKGASLLGLLQVVADHDGIRPSAIAERLEVHPSLVARQIREAEAAGFVRIAHDSADRRSLLVSLEPAGADELRRFVDVSRDRFAAFVDDWEPDEVRTLTATLERLRASLAQAAARERRQRRRHAVSGGPPAWFTDWLDGPG